jgi:hypothetical protein
MDINEARGQRAARARHDLPGVTLRQISDQRDASIDDCNIGNERAAARPIINSSGRKNRVDQGV